MPEAKLGDRCVERVNTDLDTVCRVSSMDRQLKVVEGDSTVGIGGSLQAQTEDIFNRLEGWFDFELAEQRLA